MAEPLLTLRDVRVAHGRREVLHGVSLTIGRGEIVTLIGANGAGKSTTLLTISGLLRTVAGSIVLEGEEVAGLDPAERVARGIVQVPEGRRLFSDMTVLENLELGAFLRRDRAAIADDLERVYALFPRLKERRKQLAGSLSGGEQQMCAIGRAMLARPKVLLLDEPSLGLAPLLVKQIFGIIRTLNEQGVTIFLVEQNARAALKLAARAYVLETGEVATEGDAKTLLHDARIRAAYLGED